MGTKAGFECKLYRNTGTFESPTWSEITVTRDLTNDMPIAEYNDTDRGNVEETYHPGRVDRTLTVQVRYDQEDTNYAALEAAAIAKTTLDLAVADGAIASDGTRYFRGDFKIFGHSNPQPLGDISVVDFTLRRVRSANTAGWFTVSAS